MLGSVTTIRLMAAFSAAVVLVSAGWAGWMYVQLQKERAAHNNTKHLAAKSEAEWQKRLAHSSQQLLMHSELLRTLEAKLLEERTNVEHRYLQEIRKQASLAANASAERDRLRKLIQEQRAVAVAARDSSSTSASDNSTAACSTDGKIARLLDLIPEIDELAEEATAAAVREAGRVTALQDYITRVCTYKDVSRQE